MALLRFYLYNFVRNVSFSSSINKYNKINIPCPKHFPLIGHSYLFSRRGPYNKEKLTEAAYDLSLKYGPIFFLKFPGTRFIITTDAENACKIFQHEGNFPHRIPLQALAYYQKKTYGIIGLVSGNGAEWKKLRKSIGPLLTKSYLPNFTDKATMLAEIFVKYIRKQRNYDNILSDVHFHVYKYAIECISVICVGKQLNCLENENNEDIKKLTDATRDFMNGLHKTYSELPVWNLFPTKGYKEMESGYNVINNFIESKLHEQYNIKMNSLILNLMQYSKLSQNEIQVLVSEIFFSGIDAVATTITMTLYYLSKNKRCQNIAYESIKENSRTYINACVKETLRLSPVAGGTTRSLPVDTVMNNYNVPANTIIMAFHSVTSRLEKYFDDPHLYKPERWLNKNELVEEKPYSSFASLPFGNGQRMCPGRWLAEQECTIFLTKILQKFSLECCIETDIGMIYRMNRIPERPIDLKFKDKEL